MKKKILAVLKAHLKTKKHRRPDLDYYVGKRLVKVTMFNNGWGANQEAGFNEAMEVIKKLKV